MADPEGSAGGGNQCGHPRQPHRQNDQQQTGLGCYHGVYHRRTKGEGVRGTEVAIRPAALMLLHVNIIFKLKCGPKAKIAGVGPAGNCMCKSRSEGGLS